MSRSAKYLTATLSALIVSLGVASALAIKLLDLKSSYGPVRCRRENLVSVPTHELTVVVRKIGWTWLYQARVCDIGGFAVEVPDKQRSGTVIRIYKGLKPVFFETSSSSWMYAPLVGDGRGDRQSVIEMHPYDGRVTQLAYSVWKGRSRVQVRDLNFDGTPDMRVVWRGFDIRRLDVWYKGHWTSMKRGRILISGRWRPAHFSDGSWRIGRKPAPDRSLRSSHAP